MGRKVLAVVGIFVCYSAHVLAALVAYATGSLAGVLHVIDGFCLEGGAQIRRWGFGE